MFQAHHDDFSLLIESDIVYNMSKESAQSLYLPALSGLCFLVLALGLVRYAYTPLLPALIQQHWMTHLQAGYLGAANFFGYFLGTLVAKYFTRRFSHHQLIKISALLCVLSFFACAWHLGLVWLNAWRILAGVGSAFITVLTPVTIL